MTASNWESPRMIPAHLESVPFTVRFLDSKMGRKTGNGNDFKRLPSAGTHYPGSTLALISPPASFAQLLRTSRDPLSHNRLMEIHAFTERLRREKAASTSTHIIRGQGEDISYPKLHVTYIGRNAAGNLIYRRSRITLRKAGTGCAGQKPSILANKNDRIDAYTALFPSYMTRNGRGSTLTANGRARDLCAWAVACNNHDTIYMISHDVLAKGTCSRPNQQIQLKPEGLALLALLDCKTTVDQRTRYLDLIRFILKPEGDETLLRKKVFMTEAKLRKLVGALNSNWIRRVYAAPPPPDT